MISSDSDHTPLLIGKKFEVYVGDVIIVSFYGITTMMLFNLNENSLHAQ